MTTFDQKLLFTDRFLTLIDCAEIMQAPIPKNSIEERFVAIASATLPTTDVEIGRNEWGILYYRWPSPSSVLQALSIHVKEGEIMLSTKISHTHVDSCDFREENLTEEELSSRVAHEGASKAAAIMRGEITFTETFDGQGNKFSSGLCRTDQLTESLRYARQVFGEEMTERAFTWNGEVAIQG